MLRSSRWRCNSKLRKSQCQQDSCRRSYHVSGVRQDWRTSEGVENDIAWRWPCITSQKSSKYRFPAPLVEVALNEASSNSTLLTCFSRWLKEPFGTQIGVASLAFVWHGWRRPLSNFGGSEQLIVPCHDNRCLGRGRAQCVPRARVARLPHQARLPGIPWISNAVGDNRARRSKILTMRVRHISITRG